MATVTVIINVLLFWAAALLLPFLVFVVEVEARVLKSDLFPFGPENGDSSALVSDDGFTGPLNLTFPFPFFNETYRSLFVNNNGAISFKRGISAFTPTCGALPPESTMIAPFWSDVDIRNGGSIYYRETRNQTLRTKVVAEIHRAFPQLLGVGSASLFIVTWDDVAYFGRTCSGQNYTRDTFQVVLSTDGVNSFSLLYYSEINWTTGSASGGNCSGLGGRTAKAGFDVGDGVTFFELPGSCTEDILHIDETSNMGEPGKWIFRVDNTLQNRSCNDDTTQKLQVSPSFVSAFGHEPLTILGPCLDEEEVLEVFCAFHDPLGPPQELMRALLNRNESLVVCSPPYLYTLGRVQVVLLVTRTKGRQDQYTGFVYVIEPNGNVQVTIGSAGQNDLVSVRLQWEPNFFPATVVDLEITMWNISTLGHWTQSARLGEASVSSAQFTLIVNPAVINSLVIFKLRPSRFGDPASRTGTGRASRAAALGPAAFSLPEFVARYSQTKNSQACEKWYSSDPGVPNDILPCPCFLRQAERDPRFKREETLLSFYHPGAAAGFRQRDPSPSGAGQQCTYDANGNVLTRGAGAGSADRSSPNGALGFIDHLTKDVWPWFLCHKFSNNLDKYYAKRPAHNCSGYVQPGLGNGRGDPHITTFDFVSYTFNGVGEFWMIQSNEFSMQARMEIFRDPTTFEPTRSSVFTAFVMRDSETKIQIDLSPVGGDNIRLNDELVSFVHAQGEVGEAEHFIPTRTGSITANGTRTTISFQSGFTFEITRVDNYFGILAVANVNRVGRTNGLLGYYDKNPDNDLRTPNGTVIPANSSLAEIHYQFGLPWMIRADESLFSYARGSNYDSYANPNFVPSFEVPDVSRLPEQVVAMCQGSTACLFDYVTTGSLAFANATRLQGQIFNGTVGSFAEKIRLCTPIQILQNGYVNYTTNFVNGTTIAFGCNEKYKLDGAKTLSCGFVTGASASAPGPVWSGVPPTCKKTGDSGKGQPQFQGVLALLSNAITSAHNLLINTITNFKPPFLRSS